MKLAKPTQLWTKSLPCLNTHLILTKFLPKEIRCRKKKTGHGYIDSQAEASVNQVFLNLKYRLFSLSHTHLPHKVTPLGFWFCFKLCLCYNFQYWDTPWWRNGMGQTLRWFFHLHACQTSWIFPKRVRMLQQQIGHFSPAARSPVSSL